MHYFLIATIIVFSYIFFIIFFRIKLNKIEKNLQETIDKRNNKIFSLNYITKNILNKHDEVFKEFFKLKKKDFSENTLKFYFENKLNTYKNLQKEIDFIFKICEAKVELTKNWKYNYIKNEILKESLEIWKSYDFYKKISEKYDFHHKISKIFIIWLFIR